MKAGASEQAYETPWHIVRAVELDSFGGRPFDLDVAASAANAKAPAYYDAVGNGLRSLWAAPQVWCNPTYANQGDWLARAVWHAREYGVSTASLVLASTSANNFDRASALVLVGPQFTPGVVRVRDAVTGHLITRLPQGCQPALL